MSTSSTSTSADAIHADIQEKRTGRALVALEARRREEVDRYDLAALSETLSLAEELKGVWPKADPALQNFFRRIRRNIDRVGGFSAEERERFAAELVAQRAAAPSRWRRKSRSRRRTLARRRLPIGRLLFAAALITWVAVATTYRPNHGLLASTFIHRAGLALGVIALLVLMLSQVGIFLEVVAVVFGLPVLILGLLGGWESLIMIGGVPLAAGGGGLLFNAAMGFPSISDE